MFTRSVAVVVVDVAAADGEAGDGHGDADADDGDGGMGSNASAKCVAVPPRDNRAINGVVCTCGGCNAGRFATAEVDGNTGVAN